MFLSLPPSAIADTLGNAGGDVQLEAEAPLITVQVTLGADLGFMAAASRHCLPPTVVAALAHTLLPARSATLGIRAQAAHARACCAHRRSYSAATMGLCRRRRSRSGHSSRLSTAWRTRAHAALTKRRRTR